MKHFMLVVLSVMTSLFFTGVASAQTDYTSLVQKDTIGVVRVNLSNVDSAKLSNSITKIGVAAVDYFISDKDSAEELKKNIPLGGVFASQFFNEYIKPLKDAGANDIYFVVDQPSSAEETLYPYIAIPVEGLSADNKKALRTKLGEINHALPDQFKENLSLKYRFERAGYLFVLMIPNSVSTDDVKTYIKKRFTQIDKVEKSEFTDGFSSVDPTAIVSWVEINALNKDIASSQLAAAFQKLDETGLDESKSAFVKEKISNLNDVGQTLAGYIRYNYGYASLENFEIATLLKAKSADDAKVYVEKIESDVKPILSDFVSFAFDNIGDSGKADEEKKAVLEEAKTLVMKIVDVFMQFEIEDDVVAWKMNEKFWTDNKATFDEVSEYIKAKIAVETSVEEEPAEETDVEVDEEIEL